MPTLQTGLRALTALALVLVSTASLRSAGEEPQPPGEPVDQSLLDLMELLNTPITSASKRAEKAIEAPSVVSVLTRDQFQAYGWSSVNQALYSLPGFGPSQDYDRRTVSSRGLFEGWNNNHILFLVDGIPYNDNIYGSAYTWEITPVPFIRTLEVVRGPGSALYGSNATNSVTQIKTIGPRDLPQGGEAQIRIGSAGERIIDVLAGREGDLVSAVVAFNTYRSDGNSHLDYDGSGRLAQDGSLQRFPIQDARDSHYAWAKLEGQGPLKGWMFQYHQQGWNYRTGHGWVWLAPDTGENLQEKREILALAYSGRLSERWSQEYLLRYQRHDINWNVRFIPSGEWGFPDGMSEYLDTSASDLFARAQLTWGLPREANLLLGFEGSRFSYTGDRSHYGVNIDFSDYSVASGPVPAGPWLEFIQDKPMTSTGWYAQFSSGKLLGAGLTLVLGVRADRTAFDYTRVYEPGKPGGSKSYANTSPRLALVYMPSERLAIKLMTGKAFRAPAPSELAGANTYTLASNIEQLKPETLQTTEAAVDWIISPRFNWRTNIYRTKFSDQIAYSLANANLSTNIYTLTTQGLESELLYAVGGFRGYLNYSYAQRVDEQVLDETIALSRDTLTWEPASRIKLGVIYSRNAFTAAVNLLHQGRVQRRHSDITPETAAYRSDSLDPWLGVDARVSYTLNKRLQLSLSATNLLDSDKIRLVKNMAFPFDYKGEERRVSFAVKGTF